MSERADGAPAAAPPVKKDRHVVTWTAEEDDVLREQIALHGTENWTSIAAKFKDKTGRQCRRRWFTYLNSECKKGGWSPEEDMLLCEAQKILGNRWTEIAKVVSGRTDNAVKNRFTTLCKKRSKFESSSKENKDSTTISSNKKLIIQNRITIAMAGESEVANQQIRHHISDIKENAELRKIFLGEKGEGDKLRQPLAALDRNLNGFSNSMNSTNKTANDVPENNSQGVFIQRNDPKVIALLQQAELLSSLSLKVNADNSNQSLDDAWKELQDYLIQTEDCGPVKNSSGMNFLLGELKDLLEDLRTSNTDGQLLRTESSHKSNAEGSNFSHKTEIYSEGKDKKVHNSPEDDDDSDSANEVLSTCRIPEEDKSFCGIVDSEYTSPLQTVLPFQSFADGIPTPVFTASERHFLRSVLNLSSPVPSPDPPKQPSCKRVLLDSLGPS